MEQGPDVGVVEVELEFVVKEEADHVAMLHQHAFRPAGGAGGIDDVGGVLGFDVIAGAAVFDRIFIIPFQRQERGILAFGVRENVVRVYAALHQ